MKEPEDMTDEEYAAHRAKIDEEVNAWQKKRKGVKPEEDEDVAKTSHWQKMGEGLHNLLKIMVGNSQLQQKGFNKKK